MTAKLEVKFKKPTPIDRPLLLLGRVERLSERKDKVDVSVITPNADMPDAELWALADESDGNFERLIASINGTVSVESSIFTVGVDKDWTSPPANANL